MCEETRFLSNNSGIGKLKLSSLGPMMEFCNYGDSKFTSTGNSFCRQFVEYSIPVSYKDDITRVTVGLVAVRETLIGFLAETWPSGHGPFAKRRIRLQAERHVKALGPRNSRPFFSYGLPASFSRINNAVTERRRSV
jgi:hypothetical protein